MLLLSYRAVLGAACLALVPWLAGCGPGSTSSGGVSSTFSGVGEALMFPAAILKIYGDTIIEVTDLNGDGIKDIVSPEHVGTTYRTYVHLGSFGRLVDPVPEVVLGQVDAVADLNGDGNPDLAGVYLTDDLGLDGGVWIGVGDGTFTEVRPLGLANLFRAPRVEIGRANDDDSLDLFVVTEGVQVFFGRGDGTFAFGFSNPQSIRYHTRGDLNGDGLDDFVGKVNTSSGPVIEVLTLNADETFSRSVIRPSANAFRSPEVKDLNGDGILDIAYGLEDLGIEAHLGRGDGTFDPPALSLIEGAATLDWCCQYAQIAEVNGDGVPDAWLDTSQDSSWRFARGVGDGTFESQLTDLLDPATHQLEFRNAVASEDIDGDGASDGLFLFRSSRGLRGYRLVRDLSAPKANDSNRLPAPEGEYVHTEAVELDGDAFPDFMANTVDGRLIVRFGDEELAFGRGVELDISDGVEVGPVSTDDMDGDGDSDFWFHKGSGSSSRDELGIVENMEDGVFAVRLPDVETGGIETRVHLVADMDGDGLPDLALDPVGEGAMVAYGLGGLRFGSSAFVPAFSPGEPRTADLNGDGLLDLIGFTGSNEIGVALGLPGRSFADPIYLAVPPTAYLQSPRRRFDVEDVVGDGNADLILTQSSHTEQFSRVLVLPGQGDGRFGSPMAFPVPYIEFDLDVDDVDADGDQDIVVYSILWKSLERQKEVLKVRILRNDENGIVMSDAPDLQQGYGAYAKKHIIDVDGNGLPDLVAFPASFVSGPAATAIALGTGGATFDEPLLFDLEPRYGSAIADFDGDGDADVVTTNPKLKAFVVHENRLIP